jgi:hypothetical protein
MFKSFRKVSFKGGSSYQTWKDEDESVDVDLGQPVDVNGGSPPREPEPYKDDCFYLGSQDMTGQQIQGQGCLVEPIEYIWSLTQENKPKRKSSKKRRPSSTSSTGSTPSNGDEPGLGPVKFVEIELGPRFITVRDCNTRDTLIEFSVTHVATCGVHKFIPQAFAFVAVETPKSPPFCHVFKCDDRESSSELAKRLNDWFVYHSDRFRRLDKDIQQ